ncbi:MAG: SHOCT domain-containing protein [Clostridia bacterium]|nr:SHOCT domain-containing protein [Clostridia bacterium]
MAKIPCAVCGKQLGLLSPKAKISDGAICAVCLQSAGISSLSNATSYNQQTIKEYILTRQALVKSYNATKTYGGYIEIDEDNKLFKLSGDLFEFSNLLSFELLEDGTTVTKGGLGRAVAGGLLFGGVGAIVGGVTGSKKAKNICNSMKLRVSLKNAHTDVVYITLISSETKTNGFMYKMAQDSAQKVITALEFINDINQSTAHYQTTPTQQSSADEIVKYKALLDQGIITQEEFEAKKKQLLGL